MANRRVCWISPFRPRPTGPYGCPRLWRSKSKRQNWDDDGPQPPVTLEVFVASRLNVPGIWQMPQGGIEEGEDPRSAAIRELREETGVVSVEIVAEVSQWLTYDFPPAAKAKLNHFLRGDWCGQAQKWFLMRFTAEESEINLATGEAKPEFSDWKWATPEQVIEQVVDHKRATYEEVMKTFRPYFSAETATK